MCHLLFLFISCSSWLLYLFCPDLLLCSISCTSSLAGCSRTYLWTFSSNTILGLSENFWIRSNYYPCWNFLHRVGSSDILIRCEEFSCFSGSPIHLPPPPPLDITKVLSINKNPLLQREGSYCINRSVPKNTFLEPGDAITQPYKLSTIFRGTW